MGNSIVQSGGIAVKNVYPVIFTQTSDKKDTVLIEVPDFNIFTEGYGMVNAIEMARDAIGLSGITLEDMGKKIPLPSHIHSINVEKAEFREQGLSIISMVDIDFLVYRRRLDTKAVRRNVTLPKWLNQEAERAGINVSKVLQEALMSVLNLPNHYI